MKIFTSGCALALALSMSPAQAINQEIRATFRPDPSQPSKNVFINQTPNSGYCVAFPGKCADGNMFSIELPVRYTSHRSLVPGDGISLKIPAAWRRLTITNQDTQETESVEVRITGIGSTYVLSDRVEEITGIPDTGPAHDKLWTSGWLYAAPPCVGSGLSGFNSTIYRFFWHTPVEETC
jgi:hypothetical protein